MRAEELRQLLDRRPFVPARLHLGDGSALDIRHLEMALLTRSTVEIGVAERSEERIADRFMNCTLRHIVSAENVNGERGLHDAGGG